MKKTKQPLPDIRKAARQALEQDVAWHARSLARHLSALADHGLASTALSHAQFILMCLIASAADDTVNALAQRAGLNQSTMSRNLEVLVKARLVEVTTALADRRRRAVWLTETGLFALAKAMPVALNIRFRLIQDGRETLWPNFTNAKEALPMLSQSAIKNIHLDAPAHSRGKALAEDDARSNAATPSLRQRTAKA